MCREWFHTQCEGISPKEYRKMTETQYLIWMCRKCRRSFKDITEKNRKLNDENRKIKEENRKWMTLREE